MSGPVLTVAVTADVTQLQTQLAAAKAALGSSTNELNRLAREAEKTGQSIAGSLDPKVQKLAASVAQGRLEVNQLAADLRSKLTPATDEAERSTQRHSNTHAQFGGVIGQNRAAFQELSHVVRSVADGLAAGISPARLFGEEFFRVGQALTQFNTISVSTVAGYGAIATAALAAAGAVAWFVKIEEQQRDSANLGAIFKAVNVPIPESTIQSYRRFLLNTGYEIEALGSLTSQQVDEILTNFARIPHASPELAAGLTRILPDFASLVQTTAVPASKELAAAITDLNGAGAELVKKLDPTMGLFKQFNSLRTDPLAQMKQLLTDVTEVTSKYSESTRTSAATEAQRMGMFANVRAPISGFHRENAALVNEVARATERADTAMKEFQAHMAQMPKIAPGMQEISDELLKIQQNKDTTEDVKLAKAVSLLKQYAAVANDPAINKLLDAKVYEQQEAASREALMKIQLHAEEAKDRAVATRKDQTAAELEVLKEGLKDEALTAQAREELQSRINMTIARLNRASLTDFKKTKAEEYQEFSKAEEEKLARFKGNLFEQAAVLNNWLAEAKKKFGEASPQYLEVKTRIDNADNSAAEKQKQVAAAWADTAKYQAQALANLEEIGAKSRVAEFKPSLSVVIDPSALEDQVAGQIAKLKAALNTEIEGLQKDINEKMALKTPEGTKAANADFAELTSKYKQYMDTVQRLNQETAQTVSQSWQQITSPIGNAFDSILGAAIRGSRNMKQVEAQAAASIVESWAKSALKIVEAKAGEEIQKLVLTRAGAQARMLADDTGISAVIQKIGLSLGIHAASETAKTGQTAAGATARQTEEATAMAAGKAAQIAFNASTIAADAATGAAGAWAATAMIPIVGPELAPDVAAATYGGIMSFQAVAAAEGGWDKVPFDNAPTLLHKNEMVLPAKLAEGVRQMTANGFNNPSSRAGSLGSNSSVSGDTVSHNVTLNHYPTINAPGSSLNSVEMARVLNKSGTDLHQHLSNWYGNNQASLPGRKTWR